jgi:hypothetical protein
LHNTDTGRHYCRNPKCRSKLPAPVANEREAFCTRGCYIGFHRTRCLVCEAKMERKTEQVPQRFEGRSRLRPLPYSPRRH